MSLTNQLRNLAQYTRKGEVLYAIGNDAADEIVRLRDQLMEARAIIDDLRFHDHSGRADKFMGDEPFKVHNKEPEA